VGRAAMLSRHLVRKSSTDEMRVCQEHSANPEALLPVCPSSTRRYAANTQFSTADFAWPLDDSPRR
jgi:hypothetical protein